MTLQQMLDMADTYLDWRGKGRPTPSQLVLLFNQAQDRLLSMLKHGVITDLDLTDLSQALGSSGEYDLSDLSETVWQGMRGIDGVKHTGGKFCRRISFPEFTIQNDQGRAWSGDHPAYYVRGNIIYILPYDGYTIDVYFRKQPTQMALHATNPASDTSCALNSMSHPLIVGLAVEDYVDISPEIARFYAKIMQDIEDLNDKYTTTDSLLYGVMHNPHDTGSGLDFMAI